MLVAEVKEADEGTVRFLTVLVNCRLRAPIAFFIFPLLPLPVEATEVRSSSTLIEEDVLFVSTADERLLPSSLSVSN